MKRINYLTKSLLLCGLVASAMLPWNATAINRADLTGTLVQRMAVTPAVVPQQSVAELALPSGYKPEDLLVKSLLQVTRGQLPQALQTVDALLAEAPNFKLAYLVRGDLLMAQAQQFQAFGSGADSQRIADLQDEARKRLERYLSQLKPSTFPEPLWQMNPQQPYALVVDADKSRVYLYKNVDGQPQYIADYYATIGKNGSEKQVQGDKRTPVGVYYAGGKLKRKLDDFYGDAAYPLNYPNEWDKRQGKSGHGIWLHGTPQDTYSRAPRASDGCVVLSNPDMQTLAPVLEQGNVPVIIATNLQWRDAQQSSSEQLQLQQTLEQWRSDWQSQQTERYLTHYSPDFASGNMNFERWAEDKRRIQAKQGNVDIRLSNVSMYRYPGNQVPMAVVSFDQDYKSAQLETVIRKRQYWIYQQERWQILYEGAV